MNWIVGGIVLVLTVVGLIAYSAEQKDEEAQAKAQELTQKFEQHGLRVPEDEDIIARSLGNDGGAVCENAGEGLAKATFYSLLGNGAAHVGWRPVIVDRDIVRGQLLILETYCPDELDRFRETFDELKTDDTLEN